jgi:hypothetical protein
MRRRFSCSYDFPDAHASDTDDAAAMSHTVHAPTREDDVAGLPYAHVTRHEMYNKVENAMTVFRRCAPAFVSFTLSFFVCHFALAGDTFTVCHGDNGTGGCSQHPFDKHEQCSQPPGIVGGITPNATTGF